MELGSGSGLAAGWQMVEVGEGQSKWQKGCRVRSQVSWQVRLPHVVGANCFVLLLGLVDGIAGHACIVWHIKMNDPLSLRLGVNSPTLD